MMAKHVRRKNGEVKSGIIMSLYQDDYDYKLAKAKNRRLLKKWIEKHEKDLQDQILNKVLDSIQCY